MNTAGDIAYDIYEFFLNDSPYIGDISITAINPSANMS
jgi:hypothetical protein